MFKDYLSSFADLLDKCNSFRIHHHDLQELVVKILKMKTIIVPEVMKGFFQKVNNSYSLKNVTSK